MSFQIVHMINDDMENFNGLNTCKTEEKKMKKSNLTADLVTWTMEFFDIC